MLNTKFSMSIRPSGSRSEDLSQAPRFRERLRAQSKTVNGAFRKRNVLFCVMGNQQKEGVHYQLGELYAPVMKATEVPATDEEYERDTPGSLAMACAHIHMDEGSWIWRSEQREDHIHSMTTEIE